MSSIRNFLRDSDAPASRPKRYHSGDWKELEEVSDPSTTEDETATYFREYASEHPFQIGFLLVVGVLLLVYLGFVFTSYGSRLLSNIYVQVGGLVTAVGALAYLGGRSTQRSDLAGMDWLVLLTSDGVNHYLGYYAEAETSGEPLFIPAKGFTMFGSRANPYTVADISPELARTFRNLSWDPETPAVIRLDPSLAQTHRTDWGFIVGQISSGLQLDPQGQESNLQTADPDLADEGALQDLTEELEQHQSQIGRLREEKNTLEKALDEARDRLQRSQEEAIDRFVERYRRIQRRRRVDEEDGDYLPPSEAAPGGVSQQQMDDIDEDLDDE